MILCTLSAGSQRRLPIDSSGGEKGPYGRSSKKPTVGFTCDLPWVVETTYSGFFLTPSEVALQQALWQGYFSTEEEPSTTG